MPSLAEEPIHNYAAETVVWICNDEVAAESEALATAALAQITVARMMTIAETLMALQNFAAPDLLCADISDTDETACALMHAIDYAVGQTGRSAIIAFPVNCIDAVAAAVTAPGVVLLCAPTRFERAMAMALAMANDSGYAREVDAPSGADRLQILADEVARIAAALSGLARSDLRPGGEAFSDGMIGYRAEVPLPAGAAITPVSASTVREVIRARRMRERFLPGELFADPVWDMMLDLLAARIERRRVAVSSLCIAAAVPPTTALRAIRQMTERGLFVRSADDTDRRRVFIELADETAEALTAYVASATAMGAAIG